MLRGRSAFINAVTGSFPVATAPFVDVVTLTVAPNPLEPAFCPALKTIFRLPQVVVNKDRALVKEACVVNRSLSAFVVLVLIF